MPSGFCHIRLFLRHGAISPAFRGRSGVMLRCVYHILHSLLYLQNKAELSELPPFFFAAAGGINPRRFNAAVTENVANQKIDSDLRIRFTDASQISETQIRDTDVAEEMMEYTKNNILNQSAQAMLAQRTSCPRACCSSLANRVIENEYTQKRTGESPFFFCNG